MLSTFGVNNQLLPYDSIITKMLQYFHVPLYESVYVETKRISEVAITGIWFYRRNGKWVKMTTSKTRGTLVAPEDDRMLNDIYPAD